MNKNPKKSYKREIAGAGILVWFLFLVMLVLFPAPTDMAYYEAIFASVSTMVWTAFGAMFGLHSIKDKFGKQDAVEKSDEKY